MSRSKFGREHAALSVTDGCPWRGGDEAFSHVGYPTYGQNCSHREIVNKANQATAKFKLGHVEPEISPLASPSAPARPTGGWLRGARSFALQRHPHNVIERSGIYYGLNRCPVSE
jgi:hypothetical protein